MLDNEAKKVLSIQNNQSEGKPPKFNALTISTTSNELTQSTNVRQRFVVKTQTNSGLYSNKNSVGNLLPIAPGTTKVMKTKN